GGPLRRPRTGGQEDGGVFQPLRESRLAARRGEPAFPQWLKRNSREFSSAHIRSCAPSSRVFEERIREAASSRSWVEGFRLRAARYSSSISSGSGLLLRRSCWTRPVGA